MVKTCDLHTHSVFSDGTWTPAQLIAEAERIGLSAIALTDHNTVAGLPDFLAAAEGSSVRAIPGIEFSVDWKDIELHMLGLFIQPQYYDPINALLNEGKRLKEQSNLDLVQKLAGLGYPIDYFTLRDASPTGQVNRANIAAELVRLGYFASIKEAFDRLLSQKRGYYSPPKRPDARKMIQFIRSIGAVSVLAHPLVTLDEQELLHFLDEDPGILPDAMETIYSTYDAVTTARAKAIAQAYGMKESGGSDFHGDIKPDIQLAVGRGALFIPEEIADRLTL